MTARLADGLAWQTVDGEGVVLDLERGRVLGLNPTGALVLALLEQRAGDDAIAAALCARFNVSEAQARGDLALFLTELHARGLLVPV
jgi:PqqD family protein of HPr-rel-A system